MTPGSSWGLGAGIGLVGLLAATLAGANLMDWQHVHRVPCECPAAAREFLLDYAQTPLTPETGERSTLFADVEDARADWLDARLAVQHDTPDATRRFGYRRTGP